MPSYLSDQSLRLLRTDGLEDNLAILMRSGIGPPNELKAMGIAVERDLPVGKHHFDHPLFRATIHAAPRPGQDRP
jgi:choline dehydrogenase-like flavoprotein